MTHCSDVVRLTAEALRNAPDEPGSILEDVGSAIGAEALCLVRPVEARVVANSAWRVDDGWRHATTVLGGVPASALEEVDPRAAVQMGADALSIPYSGDWTCGRSAATPTVLGAAGCRAPAIVGALTTAIDIVVARETASASSRLAALLQDRARIASVIHEGVSQELATVAVQLEVLAELLTDTPQVRELAGLTRASTRRAIATVREAILDLTPVVLDTKSMADGLRELVGEFSKRWAVRLTFEAQGDAHDVESDVAGLTYAFVQEALTNLRKHSSASAGAVRLAFDEHECRVTVCADDGTDGHDYSGVSTGQGMQLMKGRARLIGGDVDVGIGPAGGREVMLRIPI